MRCVRQLIAKQKVAGSRSDSGGWFEADLLHGRGSACDCSTVLYMCVAEAYACTQYKHLKQRQHIAWARNQQQYRAYSVSLLSTGQAAGHACMLPRCQTAALGLELKEKWCKKLLAGEKKIELRRYAIPNEFLNQPVYLLQTPDGSEGQSTLPEEHMPAGFPGACIAGIVTFSGQTVYSSYEQWAADAEKHCVPPGSPYSWQPGVTSEMFGWHIAAVEAVEALQPVPAMKRVLSSWFTVTDTEC